MSNFLKIKSFYKTQLILLVFFSILFTFIANAVAPSAPSALSVDSPGNAVRPVITITLEEAGGEVIIYNVTDCPAHFSYSEWTAVTDTEAPYTVEITPFSNLSKASTTFWAKHRNAANEESACSTASATYILDTTAPTITTGAVDLAAADDTGSSSTDNKTSNTTALTFSGTLSANASTGEYVQLYNGTAEVGTDTTFTGSPARVWSIDIALVAGTHSITAKVVDAAGNSGTASSALSVIVDATAPAVSIAAGDQPASASAGSKTASLTASDAGVGLSSVKAKVVDTAAACTISVTGLSSAITLSNSKYPYSVTGTANSDKFICFVAEDEVGNKSALASATLGTISDTPAAPSAISVAAAGTDSTPEVTVTVGATGGTVTLYSNSTCSTAVSSATSVTDTTAPITVAITTNDLGTDGTKNFYATHTNTIGASTCSTATASYILDTVVPAITTGAVDLAAADDTGSSSTDNKTSNTTALTFGGTLSANASTGEYVQLYNGTTEVGTDTTFTGSPARVWSIDIALAVGTHSITAKVVDAAGNSGTASSALSVVVDTTAPAVSIAAGDQPASGSADSKTASLTASDTGGISSVKAKVVDAAGDCVITLSSLSGAITLSDSKYPFTEGASANSDKFICFIAEDDAGNKSALASATLGAIADTPAAPSAISVAAAGSDYTPDVTVTIGESGGTVTLYSNSTCSFSASSAVSVTDTSAPYEVVITSNDLGSDGTFSFYAKHTKSSLTSTCSTATDSYILDTTDPTITTGTPDLAAADDTGSSSTDNKTSNTTALTLGGTLSAVAATGEYVQLYNGTAEVGTATTFTGSPATSWSIDITLAVGTHSITAKVVDAAGNSGTASSALSVVVDTTAPTASIAAGDQPASASGVSKTASLTASDSGGLSSVKAKVVDTAAACTISVTGLSNAITLSNSKYPYSVSGSTNSSKFICFIAEDDAGNKSSVASTTLGTITSLSTPSAISVVATGNEDTPEVTVTVGETGGTVTLYSNSTCSTAVSTATSVTDTSSPYTVAITTNDLGADGTKNFYAKHTKLSVSSTCSTATDSYILDSVAPTITTGTVDLATADDTGSSSTDNITKNTTTLTFGGTLSAAAPAGEYVQLYNGTAEVGTATTFTGSPARVWSIDITLAAGTHSITAKVVDAAGNSGTASSAISVIVDTTAPAISITNPAKDFSNNKAYSASDNDSTTTVMKVSKQTSSTCSATAGTGDYTESTNYNITAEADNSKYICFWSTDLAGNVGVNISTQIKNIDAVAPVITTTATTGFARSKVFSATDADAYSTTWTKHTGDQASQKLPSSIIGSTDLSDFADLVDDTVRFFGSGTTDAPHIYEGYAFRNGNDRYAIYSKNYAKKTGTGAWSSQDGNQNSLTGFDATATPLTIIAAGEMAIVPSLSAGAPSVEDVEDHNTDDEVAAQNKTQNGESIDFRFSS